MSHIKLDVEGMSCSACTGHVRTALLALGGVESASVSLEENTATIVFDPDLVTVDQMVAAVEEEGYTLRAGN
jgi:copper chaperone CopZ